MLPPIFFVEKDRQVAVKSVSWTTPGYELWDPPWDPRALKIRVTYRIGSPKTSAIKVSFWTISQTTKANFSGLWIKQDKLMIADEIISVANIIIQNFNSENAEAAELCWG